MSRLDSPPKDGTLRAAGFAPAAVFSEGTPPVRVLLIDDHAVVRAGYRHLLHSTAHIRVVAEAGSGAGGYRAFLRGGVDVVVIDLSLPGVGGIEVLRRMKVRVPRLRALAFSMHEEPAIVRRALAAGALGYLSKRSDPDALLHAIDEVAQGRAVIPAMMPGAVADPLRALSSREFEIFRQLAEGRSAAHIASSLCLSGKTVANYHCAIRSKLGVTSTAALAHLAIAAGVVRVA